MPGTEAKRPTANAGLARSTSEFDLLVAGAARFWWGFAASSTRRDPDIVEECKWVKPTNPKGVPVWSHNGIVCTGESYKQVVKLTFAKGASLADPSGLFNSSLEGNTRRAIDIREGEMLDARAFKALVKAAVAQNFAQATKGKR